MYFHTGMVLVLPTQCLFVFHSEITSVKIHLMADDALYVIVVSSTTPLKIYPQKK